MLTGF